MFGTFRRPVDAAADVRELEYISALHQTSSVLHTDGTVSAQDVLYLLRSRFGIDITSDDAIDIVRGLAGTSRLPMPVVEKKVWRLKRQEAAKEHEALHHESSCRLRKRRCKCFKSAEDDDEEDELAALEAQLHSLKESKTDARRGWEFPAMQRQIHREVPKNVTKLVRYDMVQMMSIILIPTILRIERRRFKPETEAPPPRDPLFAGHLNVYKLLWYASKMAHKIIVAPFVLGQKMVQKRLIRIKESLQPKPETLILDVLRILLGSLEDRDSPETKLSDFVMAHHHGGSVTTSGTTTAGTGRGRYFPELRETIVSKELIQRILLSCQQEKAAQDEILIEQMMELVGGEGAVLDERAFAHALTSDVSQWPLECEDDTTSTFYDVYGFANVECNKYAKELTPEDLLSTPSRDVKWAPEMAKTSAGNASSDSSINLSFHSAETEFQDIEKAAKREYKKDYASTNDSHTTTASDSRNFSSPSETATSDSAMVSGTSSGQNADRKARRLGKIPVFKPTAGYIDYACDSFSSLHLVVFLFGFFIAISVLLVSIVNYTGMGHVDCEESFGCKLTNTIVSWGVFALVLSLGGMFVILPISLVNQSYLSSLPQALFALVVLLLYLACPIMERFLVDYVGINVNQSYLEWRGNNTNTTLFYYYYVFGGLSLLTAIRAFGSMLVPKWMVRRFAILRLLFLPNDILRAKNTKRSGTYKLNVVIDRAYRLHTRAHKKTRARNANHETMLSFLLFGGKDAKSGGLLWSWMNFSYLNKREGVWLHSRLAIGQVCQIVVMASFSIVWWKGTQYVAQSIEAKREEIKEYGGIGTETALYFVPEAWMIYYSFIPGGIVCICVLILLILITYPNTAALVLKYRSGYLPSLHDPQFQKYRKSSVYIYYNTGNMIYAAVGSGVMFFILVAGLLFLCFWPPTKEFMVILLAWGIGLGITVGLKMVLTMLIGKNYWKGFYRNHPAAANISSLAYECWHLGLGGGVLISRLIQFLLAAAFWIGRIDSQFLSNDVEAFGYHFDTVPQKYFTEILVHEGHRHPYIERLAAMYLMRLKYGEYFSADAGAQWRIVFVLTLMPWLVNFSQAHEQNGVEDDSDETGGDENIDWQLGDSNVMAANGGNVEVSGNVPWHPADDDDSFSSVASSDIDEERQKPGRELPLNDFVSAKSFGNGNGQSGRSTSWDQYAHARSFDDN